MKRRELLEQVGGLCAGGVIAAQIAPLTAAQTTETKPVTKAPADKENKENKDDKWDWHDVREWGVEGKGWSDTADYYDRFPAHAEKTVRPAVWSLSQNSAGMLVRFRTDAPEIAARWALRSERLSMPHMPSTGVSGLDLYTQDAKNKYHWVGVGIPKTGAEIEARLVNGLIPGTRVYTVYLPLYNGVKSLLIGVPKGALFEPVAPRTVRPIAFYGTSILQGACASRTGMAHTSVLGRRLDYPVINLGLSGNGNMEQNVADLLAELDPAVYVIDCLPNMTTEMVRTRTEPLVQTVRRAHPETPIVLVEGRTEGNAPFLSGGEEGPRIQRAALRKAYDNLRKAGDQHLLYVTGEQLLGDGGELTVDGSHPTDTGFVRYADILEPVLRPLIH